MIIPNPTGYEGPRRVLPEERDAVTELRCSVFFPNGPDLPELIHRRPIGWQPECIENTFAMFHRGAPVCAITRLERDFVTHGCVLRMGYIGGVCTHPDHRRRGLASTVLAACMDVSHKHGVDFVHISGSLPIYLRAGARFVGGRKEFALTRDALAVFEDSAVRMREAQVDDASWMAECGLREPVHFVRPVADYEVSIQHRHCTGAACRFHIVLRGDSPAAYVITTEPNESGESALFECAGEPRVVLAALYRLLSDGGRIAAEFAASDARARLLEEAGVEGTASALPRGTMKALDFARTMKKLQPYVAARLPAAALDWTQGAGRYVGWAGRDVLTIDGEENMLWTLLGPPPDKTPSGIHAAGVMAALVQECLPIPVPSIYMNNI